MIHKNIKKLRQKNSIAQDDIAKVLGISAQTYDEYESGNTEWTDELLIKLALYYNVSVDFLLNLTEEIAPYPEKK